MYKWRSQDTFDLCICNVVFSCIYWYKCTFDNIENSTTEFLSGFIGFYVLNITMGMSVFAWIPSFVSYAITNDQWLYFTELLQMLEEYEWIGYAIFACFSFTAAYVIHGFYLFTLTHVMDRDTFDKLGFYKLQKNKRVSLKQLYKAIWPMAWNLIFIAYPFLSWIAYKTITTDNYLRKGPLPSFYDRLLSLISVILMNEILFYYTHRALHHPYLYKKFHKMHHEFTSPIGLVAIYCTPFEFIVSDLMPLSVGLFFPHTHHVYFALVWIISANIATQVHHSGILTPYRLGIDEQPEFHDIHHKYFNCNYGAIGILDRLHGTVRYF